MTDAVRVLHVDDDPDFAELAGAFLERADDRLAIVEQIADAHGWSVDLRERAAGGTRVEISGVEFLD
jgi:CheY-like chemotaxis protein